MLTMLMNYINKQAVLALYAAKRISGIVVHIGFNVTSVVPGNSLYTHAFTHILVIREQNIMVPLIKQNGKWNNLVQLIHGMNRV